MPGMYVKERQLVIKFIEKSFSRGRGRGYKTKFIRVERYEFIHRQRRKEELGEYPEGSENDQEIEQKTEGSRALLV